MAREEIPINPAILTWARSRSGYTLEEAAKDFKQIAAWEAGDSFPSYPQLELKLAEKFKLPIAVFFFPEPPTVPQIDETFRTLPEQQLAEIPRRVRFLLRKAKALQLNLSDLNQGANPSRRLITRDLAFVPGVQVVTMAQQVRDYIGITLERQRAWENIEVALENWRHAFGDVGVFVFKDAFKVEEYSGFCLYDEQFPIIYVNNTTAKTRQIFTLFHELAHLLFHTSGVDTLRDQYIDGLAGDARQIEIICNRFASAFLVPEVAFEAAVAGRAASEQIAAELAARFHVSREFIYRKFLDRRQITEDVYSRAAKRWAAQSKPSAGGDFYNTQIAYLGPEYIRLALGQFYKNRINDIQLAEYLNIAPKKSSDARSAIRSEAGMSYVFDNSPLSTLFRNYYPQRFPTLWKRFDKLVADGLLISTREVLREIEDGPIESLTAWAWDNESLFPTPAADEGTFVAKIYAVPHFQQNIEQQKILKGGKNADAFVIAKAAIDQRTVVTMETLRPGGSRIPNICEHFKVLYLSLEGFMEKEGWQF